MYKLPVINKIKQLVKTKCFSIEQLNLTFSNGQKRIYERLKGSKNGAVLVVPILDRQTVLMIYEYAAGTQRYELAFPKGKIDGKEGAIAAANRELKEEIGYGARQLDLLKITTLAPGYQSNFTHIVLAQDLYTEIQIGDEPEPPIVVKKSLNQLQRLINDKDLSEDRSIAALYMAKAFLDAKRKK